MQRKLKSVFRRSSKSRGSPDRVDHHNEASSPQSDRRRVSSDQHGRTSVDSSVNGSAYAGRSRPVSSVYDDRRQSQASAKHTAADFSTPSDPNGGAIANDYKAYLPALSPVNDDHGEEYISMGNGRHHVTGDSEVRHEEDVADRNIARYSTSIDGGSRALPSVPHKVPAGTASQVPSLDTAPTQQHLHKHTRGNSSVDKHTGSRGATSDGVLPHIANSPHENGSSNRSSFPPKALRTGDERVGNKSIVSDKHTDSSSRLSRDSHEAHATQSGIRHATVDGTASGKETDLARKLREDGVIDLRNTIDTDGDVTWAPAVTHEVIKPHQHEMIQHKIYREIHNYEYFHRIQPVMVTEVLPPRHWIPNPNGEGLIEISADELPARTGENRWWSICEHSSPYALQKTTQKYRTEPEIIEAGTTITAEGFERKETIIIHPPTLADLTGYAGLVQAVHFDHKTGKRWMGELTTVDKLQELQQTLDRASDSQAFEMGGLAESLPKTSSNHMPLRKPVSGHSSTTHGSNVGRKLSVA